MARTIILPHGSFEYEFSQLRRAVRILPQADVLALLQDATLQALRDYEQKFWEELFMEEGESNCRYWAKLTGILDPVVDGILRALGRRRDGDDSEWLALSRPAPTPPLCPALDFTSDDMTGFLMYFEE
jgi:hypothetical protein